MSQAPALALRPQAEINPTTALRAMLDAESYWPREILDKSHVLLETTTGPLLFLTGPDQIQAAVMSDASQLPRSRLQQRFAGNGTGRGNVITDTGRRSTVHRRALAPLFRAQKLGDYLPAIHATVRQAVDPWFIAADEGASIDVGRASVHATFGVVWQIMFGERGRPLPPPPVFDMAEALYAAGMSGQLRETSLAIEMATQSSLAMRPLHPLAEDTPFGRTPLPGLELTPQEVEDNVRFLLTAGHESTALTVTWALLMLALHPDIQASVSQEIDAELAQGMPDLAALRRLAKLGRVLDEAMRLYPSAILVNREAVTDLVLAGVPVRSGTQVALCFYGLHRHRAWWDRPDSFDPDRFDPAQQRVRHRAAFMPFSAGHHSCLGGHLAWLEAMTILATALRSLSISVEGDCEVRPLARYTLRPDRPVILRFSRRAAKA